MAASASFRLPPLPITGTSQEKVGAGLGGPLGQRFPGRGQAMAGARERQGLVACEDG